MAQIRLLLLLVLIASAYGRNTASWKHVLASSQESSTSSQTSIDFLKQKLFNDRISFSAAQHTFLPVKKDPGYNADIPAQFDGRGFWTMCKSIGNVHNQGCCVADYAIAPTSMLTDRTCIGSNGTDTRTYSSYHPLGCCPGCARNGVDRCLGGDPAAVLNYWIVTGITTGGAYGSGDGCLPYPFLNTCLGSTCPAMCHPGYSGTVLSDVSRGLSVYAVPNNVKDIQNEIFMKGPVVASFALCSDYLRYKTGVYQSSDNAVCVGVHSVKLIGWGSDGGVDYWLGVDSFGSDWGDGGVIKMLRGTNHLGVEANVIAGQPNV